MLSEDKISDKASLRLPVTFNFAIVAVRISAIILLLISIVSAVFYDTSWGVTAMASLFTIMMFLLPKVFLNALESHVSDQTRDRDAYDKIPDAYIEDGDITSEGKVWLMTQAGHDLKEVREEILRQNQSHKPTIMQKNGRLADYLHLYYSTRYGQGSPGDTEADAARKMRYCGTDEEILKAIDDYLGNPPSSQASQKQ